MVGKLTEEKHFTDKYKKHIKTKPTSRKRMFKSFWEIIILVIKTEMHNVQQTKIETKINKGLVKNINMFVCIYIDYIFFVYII